MAEPVPVTSETPETRPVTETDEMSMETDDHATEIPIPEPPLASPPVPPPQLTRHRIYGNVDLQWNTKEASNLE